MVFIPGLASNLAPDTVRRLERAAEHRYQEGDCLKNDNRLLGALYLYGYSVEMCLAAACFRSAGFDSDRTIDREDRASHMTKARQQQHADGDALMNSDPHPIVGWARLLEWQRTATEDIAQADRNKLREAIGKANLVYRHWRPELRYKVTHVSREQLTEVRFCVHWFLKQRGRL